MVKDARWPALPLMIVRGVQLFFAILVLGMSGYLVSAATYTVWWGFSMTLTAAVFTLVYVAINFVLFFTNLLLPLAVVIADATMTLFWVLALAGLGESGWLALSCTYYSSDVDAIVKDTGCQCIKAGFGFSFLIFLSFIGTLAFASVVLHRNRKDLRGANYNSGMDPACLPLQPEAAVAMGDVPVNIGYPEPKQAYPQPTPTPVYYSNQRPVISPSATPAPQGNNKRRPLPNAVEMPTRQSLPNAVEMPAR